MTAASLKAFIAGATLTADGCLEPPEEGVICRAADSLASVKAFENVLAIAAHGTVICDHTDKPEIRELVAAIKWCLLDLCAAINQPAEPVEPTQEMLAAGERAWRNRNLQDPQSEPIRDCYRAMRAAAPRP